MEHFYLRIGEIVRSALTVCVIPLWLEGYPAPAVDADAGQLAHVHPSCRMTSPLPWGWNTEIWEWAWGAVMHKIKQNRGAQYEPETGKTIPIQSVKPVTGSWTLHLVFPHQGPFLHVWAVVKRLCTWDCPSQHTDVIIHLHPIYSPFPHYDGGVKPTVCW